MGKDVAGKSGVRQMFIDETVLRPEANNLTLVRLVLATAVIITHCFWRVYGLEGQDDFSRWLGVPLSVYAVDGFFFLSGFLVYPSLIRRNHVGAFLTARLARLWPALAVSVIGTALIGMVLSQDGPAAYFHGPTLRFLLGNLSFVASSYTLTGLRCGAELCNVNGSLWTLPWEARCYLVLAALLFVGLARPGWMVRLILPATLGFALAWHLPTVQEFVRHYVGNGAVYQLGMWDRLWTLFAAGIAASIFRDRIWLSWWLCTLLLLASLIANRLGVGLHVRTIFIGYAVLCAGFLSARNGAVSGNWPDYSYGMYIYAFPVMMALAWLMPTAPHLLLAAANVGATLPLAVLSWHFVEKPVLEFVRRRSLRTGR